VALQVVPERNQEAARVGRRARGRRVYAALRCSLLECSLSMRTGRSTTQLPLIASSWLLPLLTLGVVSVGTFCAGAMPAVVAIADHDVTAGGLWGSALLMLLGAVGMWWTLRLTPERT
jgi:hypothetical protein